MQPVALSAGSSAWWLQVVLALVLLAAACTDEGASSADTTPPTSDDPSFEYVGAVTALGDDGDLVVLDTEPAAAIDPEGGAVVDGGPRPVGAAIRRQDGTWVELPDPPPLVAAELLPVDDTVAVVGLGCPDDPCGDAVLAGALLADDRSAWTPLSFDLDPADAVDAYDNGPSVIGPGWVRWLSDVYHLVANGGAQAFPTAEDQLEPGPFPVTGWGSPPGVEHCVAGETLLAVGTIQLDDTDAPGVLVQAITWARVLDPHGDEPRWEEVAADALRVLRNPFRLCAPNGPIVLDEAGEVAFDAASRSWTTRSSTIPLSLGDGFALLQHRPLPDGRLLIWAGIDGRAAVLDGEPSPLVVRHPDGRYEITDVVVDEVVTSGDVSYALTAVDDDPLRPARYRTIDIRPLDLPG